MIDKLVTQYNKGAITRMELVNSALRHVTFENAGHVALAHPELMSEMLDRAANLPADDDEEGWSKPKTFCIIAWVGPPGSYEKYQQEEQQKTRKGVRHLRAWFSQKSLDG